MYTSEVTDEVSVSCAASIRKLMWSAISWVESREPSSLVARHNSENRSVAWPCRRFGISLEKKSTITLRPFTPRHIAVPGTGERTRPIEAASMSTKAR